MDKGESVDFKEICENMKGELVRLHSEGQIEYCEYSYLFDSVEKIEFSYDKMKEGKMKEVKQPKFKVGDGVYNKILDDFYLISRVETWLAGVDEEGNPTGFVYWLEDEKGVYTEEAFIPVTFFKASVMPRYWEDAKVNGVEDTDGTLIPCRNGDEFEIIIDIKTGQIINWEKGKAAKIHYKICDQGEYYLLNDKKETVFHQSGYVPYILSPDVDNLYFQSSDYMVMRVDGDGYIQNWQFDTIWIDEEQGEWIHETA